MTENTNITPETEVITDATHDKVENTETQESVVSTESQATESIETGDLTTHWTANLPGELKDTSFVHKFKDKDLSEVIKSAISAEKLIGKRVEDFSKEEVDAFMIKQGMPEAPEGYKFPEEVTEKEVFADAFHKAKLTQEQATALNNYLVEKQREESEALTAKSQQAMMEAKEILTQEFGDAVEKRINLAKNTITELGGPDLLQHINRSGLGNNPAFIKMMAKVGVELGEHTMIASDAAKNFGLTSSDRQAALSQIMSDPAQMEAWKNPTHPNHTLVKAKVKELMED